MASADQRTAALRTELAAAEQEQAAAREELQSHQQSLETLRNGLSGKTAGLCSLMAELVQEGIAEPVRLPEASPLAEVISPAPTEPAPQGLQSAPEQAGTHLQEVAAAEKTAVQSASASAPLGKEGASGGVLLQLVRRPRPDSASQQVDDGPAVRIDRPPLERAAGGDPVFIIQ